MTSATGWGVTAPEPLNLIVPLPHGDAPDAAALVATLARHLDGDVTVLEPIDTGADPESAPLWCAAIAVPGREIPFVAWVERARGLDAPDGALPGAPAAGGWVLGLETVLDAGDPLADYAACVRVVARGLPDATALLDVNTTRWYPRRELDALFLGPAEPPADVLWVTQVVAAAGGSTWLHTHGLARCGAPELEMLEVPEASAAAAAALLDCVAGLVLEDGPTPPGAAMDVGADMRVALVSWRDVAPFVPPGAPGGMGNRGPADAAGADDEAHAGVRAVICAPDPRGELRKLWVWPEQAVRRIGRGEGALFLTSRETRRQQVLARATWDELLAAIAAAGRDTRCIVKAAFPATAAGDASDADADADAYSGAGAGADREHLWFEVTRAEPERVSGRLLDAPVTVAELAVGDERWIERDRVSDWRVITPGRTYGPGERVAGDEP